MKKFTFMPLIILLNFSLHAQVAGVGIDTSNPQQKLHIASPTGTIRVDGLNSPNNPYNGGGVDKTYPLYVDYNGDMTLKRLRTKTATEVMHTPLPQSTERLP